MRRPAVFELGPCLACALALACVSGCSSESAGAKSDPDFGGGSVDGGYYNGPIGPGLPGSTEPFPKGDADVDGGKWDALPAPPQVVYESGATHPAPVIVAVFFANEDPSMLPTLEAVYSGLGSSSMWAVGQEYGVGRATTMNIQLSEDAPATIDDTTTQLGVNTALQTWLLDEVASSALPAPTSNTTYMINYPATTTVTANGTQCNDFEGYHSDAQSADGATTIAYVVVPHCTEPGLTYLDTFSVTVSHEGIEAATDPLPDFSPGWSQADDAHLFFDEANSGSEIADLCENDPEAVYEFAGFPYRVQRVWSNASARAGHDPCVPEIPGAVYFNAVPELPDTGPYDYYMTNVEVSSVHIPVGGTKTIFLDLYSDGAIPDWDVIVVDYNYFYSNDPTQALLDVAMPVTKGNQGDRLPVQLTVKAAGDMALNGQSANTELFLIYSSRGTSLSAPAHMWFGVVTN